MRKIFILFLMVATLGACNKDGVIVRENYGRHPITEASSPFGDRVLEYRPAPGQFINNGLFGGFTGLETTPEAAALYAERRLAGGDFVSLGGFGGYIVVGFDHSVQNQGGYYGYDFSVEGNQFPGGSEPGIVYVMQDSDGNGLPDETWYELRGAMSFDAMTDRAYSVTYYKPEGARENVRWTDSRGGEGSVKYIPVNNQDSYYPLWIAADSYSLSGPCLADRSFTEESGRYNTGDYGWGYVDSWSEDSMLPGDGKKSFFKIDDAVDPEGNAVELKYIDFVKVQTAINVQGSGGVGELSTEVFRFTDENINGNK